MTADFPLPSLARDPALACLSDFISCVDPCSSPSPVFLFHPRAFLSVSRTDGAHGSEPLCLLSHSPQAVIEGNIQITITSCQHSSIVFAKLVLV